MRSFADPDTHFHVVVSHTPVTEDGFKMGEPTGEVRCCECGAVDEIVEDIPHDPDCSQRFVVSEYWFERASVE